MILKKKAHLLLRLIIGISIVAFLVLTFDPGQIAGTLKGANPCFLLAAVALYCCTLAILTGRWQYILKKMNIRLGFREAYTAFTAGILLSDITPARIGDFSRPLLIRQTADIPTGTASVVLDRYADLITILLLGTTGLFVLSAAYRSVLLLLIPCLLILLILPLILVIIRPALALKITGYIRIERLRTFVNGVIDVISRMNHPGSLMAKTISLTAFVWLLHALRIALIALSVGYTVSLAELVLLQPLVSALSLIPVSIAGLGLVEGGLAAVLAQMGIPLSAGLSVALLDRMLTVAVHLIIGGKKAVTGL